MVVGNQHAGLTWVEENTIKPWGLWDKPREGDMSYGKYFLESALFLFILSFERIPIFPFEHTPLLLKLHPSMILLTN